MHPFYADIHAPLRLLDTAQGRKQETRPHRSTGKSCSYLSRDSF